MTISVAVLATCRQAPSEAAPAFAGQVRSVDHALCLLDFTGIRLQTLPTGHHTVDVVLNGKPATFIIDSGANVTILNSTFVKEFGVGPATSFPGPALGAGGAMSAQLVGIKQLRIGGVPIRIDRIAAADLGRVLDLLRPGAGKPIHGIIGQDVLVEHRAVLDVARASLYLIAEDYEPAAVAPTRCVGSRTEPR
jgi:hypothetical protein